MRELKSGARRAPCFPREQKVTRGCAGSFRPARPRTPLQSLNLAKEAQRQRWDGELAPRENKGTEWKTRLVGEMHTVPAHAVRGAQRTAGSATFPLITASHQPSAKGPCY